MIATTVCSRLFALSREHTLLCAVHSVFDRAFNLEAEGREGLIGVMTREITLSPYAVSVRTERPFPETGIRAGMAAAICGGRITIPQAEIDLDLSCAAPVDLSCDSIEIMHMGAAVTMLRDRIAAALNGAQAIGSLAPLVTGAAGNTYTRFLAPRLERLYAAVITGSSEAAASAAGRVAGCGMGLTPSSDDLLAGYLTTLYLLFRLQGREHLRGIIPRMAQAAAERTNRVSATFLLHGGEGLANAAVYDLYRAAFQFLDEAAAGRAIERALAIGSTSGADMLTGVALALRLYYGGNAQW
jgi:hypothetical protein